MSVKTWEERCEELSDMHIVTREDVRQAMLGEIDDLREQLAAARAERDREQANVYTMVESCKRAEAERDDAIRTAQDNAAEVEKMRARTRTLDAMREMLNVQDNQIDALRALLREAQVWLAQDEELDRRIDAALAAPGGKP